MILKNMRILKLKYLFLFLLIGVLSCDDDETFEVVLYEKGTAEATASTTNIEFGESVDFASTSTKTVSAAWTFAGGDPSSSTAENVTVTYNSPGTFEAKLEVKYIDNQTETKTFTIVVNGPDTPIPFGGTAAAIPGTIEAENYNIGGQGVAYNDTEQENLAETAGSATYRDDDGVDVQVSGDGTLINIGYTNADEWTQYTVDVAAAGSYDFEFFVASDPGGFSLKLQSFNADTGVITDLGETGDFAGTGGWGTYSGITVPGINLPAGTSHLRVLFTGGSTNLDKIVVTEASTGGGGGIPLGPQNIAFATDDIPGDQGYIDLLEAAGHTVTAGAQWADLDATKAANLNTFDLVIISRNTNSGQFGDAARPFWTTVTTPILNMSAFVTRNNRLQNFDSGEFNEGGSPSILAVDESHPVFTGIDLTAGSTGAITTAATLHVAGIANAGNGTLIATAADPLYGAIGYWDANTASYAGADVFAAKRMFLAGTGGGFTYNDIGSQLFLNCVEYIISGTVFGGGGNPDIFAIYTEKTENVVGSAPITASSGNAYIPAEVTTGAFEGTNAYHFEYDTTDPDTWGVMGIFDLDASYDFTGYTYYNIAIKTTSPGNMKLRIRGGGTNAWVYLDSDGSTYGLVRDGQWHTLKIPLADFAGDGGALPNLADVDRIMVLRSDEANPPTTPADDWDYFIDDIYLSN